MSVLTDLQTAQAAEKADIAALVSAIGTLLTAFANGSLSTAQASAIATEMNAEDSSIKGLTTSINTALGTTGTTGS